MILHAYECPECQEFHREVNGTIDEAGLVSIRCPHCGEVETFQRFGRRVPA